MDELLGIWFDAMMAYERVETMTPAQEAKERHEEKVNYLTLSKHDSEELSNERSDAGN